MKNGKRCAFFFFLEFKIRLRPSFCIIFFLCFDSLCKFLNADDFLNNLASHLNENARSRQTGSRQYFEPRPIFHLQNTAIAAVCLNRAAPRIPFASSDDESSTFDNTRGTAHNGLLALALLPGGLREVSLWDQIHYRSFDGTNELQFDEDAGSWVHFFFFLSPNHIFFFFRKKNKNKK
jgi:hypothetical protein